MLQGTSLHAILSDQDLINKIVFLKKSKVVGVVVELVLGQQCNNVRGYVQWQIKNERL